MLTPKEVSEKSFDKTFGFGYRMDDVDAFLGQTAQSMTELLEINADLERKLEVLADKLTEYREDEESLRTALLGAQKLGDSVIRESKTKAEIVMRDATIKAEAMIHNAKRQIDREHESLARLQREVASFKNRLLALYKQHLELVSALPGEVVEDITPKKKPAAPKPEAVEPPAPSADQPLNESVEALRSASVQVELPEEEPPVSYDRDEPRAAFDEEDDDRLPPEDELFDEAEEDDEDDVPAAPTSTRDTDTAVPEKDISSFFERSLDIEDDDDEDIDLSFFKQQQEGDAPASSGTISTSSYDGGGLRFGEAYKLKRETRLPRFKK